MAAARDFRRTVVAGVGRRHLCHDLHRFLVRAGNHGADAIEHADARAERGPRGNRAGINGGHELREVCGQRGHGCSLGSYGCCAIVRTARLDGQCPAFNASRITDMGKRMETIAFIGCGAMGAPIAERLIDAGYRVRLFDPRAEAMAPLVARGGEAAKSPREAATGAEVAFACLPAPEISRSVAHGADGVIGSDSIRVHVEMSTIGSKTVKAIAAELAKKNIAMIDSPVSGGPRGARAGTLSTMAAGEHAAFERVKPMLQALARNVFYVGEKPGLAEVTKLA